uniref:J domain-containing protein n=1 Tax=Macrostomum lignano TaxID=282301 RepID=A0A1I8HBD4_9PLAT
APGFLAQCEQHFGTKDLYAILGCESTASPAQLKKAYYKKSLELHPDTNRVDEKANATAKFQVLSKAYSLLGDEEKRRIYDESGEVDDDSGVELAEEFQRWEDYWRLLFPRAYLEFDGDMDKVLESVLFADYPDEDRIAGIIRQLIDSGEVPAFEAFTAEPAAKKARRKRAYERERREFDKANAEEKRRNGKGIVGLEDEAEEENGLAKAIQLNMRQRAGAMESLIDSLAAKYGGSGSGGKKAKKPATVADGGIKKRPKKSIGAGSSSAAAAAGNKRGRKS